MNDSRFNPLEDYHRQLELDAINYGNHANGVVEMVERELQKKRAHTQWLWTRAQENQDKYQRNLMSGKVFIISAIILIAITGALRYQDGSGFWTFYGSLAFLYLVVSYLRKKRAKKRYLYFKESATTESAIIPNLIELVVKETIVAANFAEDIRFYGHPQPRANKSVRRLIGDFFRSDFGTWLSPENRLAIQVAIADKWPIHSPANWSRTIG